MIARDSLSGGSRQKPTQFTLYCLAIHCVPITIGSDENVYRFITVFVEFISKFLSCLTSILFGNDKHVTGKPRAQILISSQPALPKRTFTTSQSCVRYCCSPNVFKCSVSFLRGLRLSHDFNVLVT